MSKLNSTGTLPNTSTLKIFTVVILQKPEMLASLLLVTNLAKPKSRALDPAIWSHDTGQQIPCLTGAI